MNKLRLGTRASALARWQANWVSEQLTALGIEVELVPITTQGDTARERLSAIGGSGLFTKELQRALLANEIDLAVHSLKDLPTDDVAGLILAAVPEREVANDVLISRLGERLDALPLGAAIGTGSLRRRAQLLHRRADLKMRDIRGNVDTRLEKLANGKFDALVLAQAGLKRLGLDGRITQVLDESVCLPAVGQGALGLETRAGDASTRAAVERLNHVASHQSVLAERAMLAALAGGCLAPVGAHARVMPDGTLHLAAVVLSADGRQRLTAQSSGEARNAKALGVEVAGQLLDQGAATLIQQSRDS